MASASAHASALARLRWSKPDADRNQPREAGKEGGRPVTCTCACCPKCKRRQKRNGGLLSALFMQSKYREEI